MKRLFALLAFTIFLSACTTNPPPPVPDMTFEHLNKVYLKVNAIEVSEETSTDTSTPANTNLGGDDLLPMPLDMYVKRWIHDRLVADHSSGHVAKVTIKKSHLERVALPMKEGFVGFFSKQPSEQFNGVVSVSLDIIDTMGRSVASAEVTAEHARTVLEDATLNERRHIMFDLVSALLNSMDREMSKQMQTYLADFSSVESQPTLPVPLSKP